MLTKNMAEFAAAEAELDALDGLRAWIEAEAEDRGTAEAFYPPERQCAPALALVTALRAERDALKRLLRESTDWNWIDFEEDCENPVTREESKITEPRLWKLREEIK